MTMTARILREDLFADFLKCKVSDLIHTPDGEELVRCVHAYDWRNYPTNKVYSFCDVVLKPLYLDGVLMGYVGECPSCGKSYYSLEAKKNATL